MSLKVHFVSRNPGKVISISSGMAEFGIQVVHYHAELVEIQSDSTEAIAAQKALDGFALTKAPTVALDAGFCLSSLGDFPGPYIEYVLRKLGIERVIAIAKSSGGMDCYFTESFAYYDGTGQPEVYTERIPGKLTAEVHGILTPKDWSPLSLAFMPDGLNVTLSEMTKEQSDQWREHRHVQGTYYGKMAEYMRGLHSSGPSS